MLERTIIAEGYSLVQVQAPKSFLDKSLADLAVGTRYRVLVVAIRRTTEQPDNDESAAPTQTIISAPGPTSIIRPGDVLVLIGNDEAIGRFPKE